MKRDIHDYQGIINLPRHISKKHPHMLIHDRAAQFAPFAALTGHGEAISETARTVDSRIVLGEDAVQEFSEKLNCIQGNIKNGPAVIITYFVPDSRKNYGGRYVTKQTGVKKTDDIKHTISLTDGTEVRYNDILVIEIE